MDKDNCASVSFDTPLLDNSLEKSFSMDVGVCPPKKRRRVKRVLFQSPPPSIDEREPGRSSDISPHMDIRDLTTRPIINHGPLAISTVAATDGEINREDIVMTAMSESGLVNSCKRIVSLSLLPEFKNCDRQSHINIKMDTHAPDCSVPLGDDIYLVVKEYRDPCQDVDCPVSQVCQLDDNRNPLCRCNAICSPDFRPVCGSDGKTYINECTLRVEACKSRRSLRIIYNGECSAGANPCENLQCGPGQECDIDRYGIATCQCPQSCEPVMRPVCGTDGETYHSECDMRQAGCHAQKIIPLDYRGPCGTVGSCFQMECEHGALCMIKKKRPICECPSCAEYFEPVCGTDGISYINECKLRKEACEQMKVIAVAYGGLCSGCENKHCEYYAACESDPEGVGRCVCPQSCVNVDSVVCGTDGVTYPNECEMRAAACKKEQYIMVGSRGPCDLCQNVHCKHGARCENGHCVCALDCPEAYDPVCSSDGVTYRNECEMRRGSCQKGVDLATVFYGECDRSSIGTREDHDINTENHACDRKSCYFGGVCNHDAHGIAQCICSFHCSTISEPVCGSDGRRYENECRLREESCRQQYNIQVVPLDHCGDMQMLPCEGEQPLRDFRTGKEFFCGDGPGSSSCPPNSYCHKTVNFATCCREVVLMRTCRESVFGCCPDGFTLAHGPGYAGCPSVCNCNRLGSIGDSCNPVSHQCQCKTGVGGERCDRCEPGYWGLHKIAADGNVGCTPCDCNVFGSARDDCEQMTGRCVCKHGIQGLKCDICPTGTVLGEDGCMDESLARSYPGTCSDLQCKFGATCKDRSGRSQCFCEMACPQTEDAPRPICGTDGNTYMSVCQMTLFSCRYQKPISIRLNAPCKTGLSSIGTDDISPTAGPVRRSTVQKTTLHQYDSKSTRDVSQSEHFFLSTGPTTSKPSAEDPPVQVPSFSGRSFLELPKLQAYTRLSLELEFKTFSDEGILIYNGQTASGAGDFVSLSVKDGFVEFRYNLGSGPIVLRSPHRLQTGRFHRLVAKRYLRDGVLTLDGQEDVAGHSDGTLKSLDLGENLFLGFVPTENKGIFENLGVSRGLIGCIRRLRVGKKEVDLTYPISKEVLHGQNIRECLGRPCNSLPCQNGGTCVPEDAESFKCLCLQGFSGVMCQISQDPCASHPCAHGATCISLPPDGFSCSCTRGHSGRFCEHKPTKPISVEEVYLPDLDGTTFLELPTLQSVGQDFVIEIWFLSRSSNGMLLYNGQESLGRGDFVALNLVNNYVEFLYDLGSGFANITSPLPINLNQWHVVRATRILRRGSLQIDDGPMAIGESKGPLSELNLDRPLYIGGYRHLSTINPESGITSRFKGAFQRFVLNGEVVDGLRKVAKSSPEVGHYYGPPCGPNPCHNGGMCLPQLNNFHCKCPVAYTGLWCEKYIEKVMVDEPIMLDGKTFLKFPDKISMRDEIVTGELKEEEARMMSHIRVEVTFRTEAHNGLLLWSHEDAATVGNYLALAVVDQFLELSFNFGKQREPLVIRHGIPVDNGQWHRAVIDRNNRHGMLQVDDASPVVVTSTQEVNHFNTDGVLWIGGCSNLPSGLPVAFYRGFEGCIHSVIVDGEALKIAMHGTGQRCPET